jgi:hypothetical protein
LSPGGSPAFASCARLQLDKLKHVPPNRFSEASTNMKSQVRTAPSGPKARLNTGQAVIV